jgi:hypothetical protein
LSPAGRLQLSTALSLDLSHPRSSHGDQLTYQLALALVLGGFHLLSLLRYRLYFAYISESYTGMSGFKNDIETDGIPTPSGEMASSSVSAALVSRESVIMTDSELELERRLKEVQFLTAEQEEEVFSKFLLIPRLFRCAPLTFNR